MEYQIKSRIWIELDNNVLLGKGRVQLLKAIAETGSLSKGSKKIGMSYKKAWSLIDSINKTAKKPLLITSVGGKGGGGAILTAYGEQLIIAYENIIANTASFLNQEAATIKNTANPKDHLEL